MLRRIVHDARPLAHQALRLAARRPLAALVVVLWAFLVSALGTFKLLLYGEFGRNYYNYVLTFTPDSLVKYIPTADWDLPQIPPRWV